uniref:Peptidase aspartic putative domain-containing protein n=1 Tax=Strigamia maritima TaxID=126957 RepID=T1JH28_STRMM
MLTKRFFFINIMLNIYVCPAETHDFKLKRTILGNEPTPIDPTRLNGASGESKKKLHLHRKRGGAKASSVASLSVVDTKCQFCGSTEHDKKACPLTAQGICLKCLGKTPHKTEDCRTTMKCFRCEGPHHTILCEQPRNHAADNIATKVHAHTVVSRNIPKYEFLMILIVNVMDKRLSKPAVCFVDGRAQRTFIRTDLAKNLNLGVVGTGKMMLSVLGREPTIGIYNLVELTLSPMQNKMPGVTIEAVEVPHVTSTPCEVPNDYLSQKLKKKGVQVTCKQVALYSNEVDLLIGKIANRETKFIEDNLIAVNTKFGCTLYGQTINGTHILAASLEAIGIQHESMTDTDETEVLRKFSKSIRWTITNYSVTLSWIIDSNELKDNFTITEQRFMNLDWYGIGRAKIRVLRQTRVLFGAAPSPFLLNATIKHHIKNYESKYPATFELLNSFLYVDDLISSVDKINQALDTFNQSREMQLVKWQTNSSELRAIFRKDPNDAQVTSDEEPKCLEVKHLENCVIHVFCNPSPRAYGIVAYIQDITEDLINSFFILSKCRVAPVKALTMPKLELMGALIAVRVADQLKEVTHCREVQVWTDSRICLHWIRNTAKRPPTFIQNRVLESRDKSKLENWRHVSVTDNPADCLTRGLTIDELLTDQLWWSGFN